MNSRTTPRLILAVLSFCALPAFGGVVNYPSNLSTVIDSGVNPAGEFGFFWSAARGDSISQTFTGTGLTSVNSLALSFGIDDVLLPGNETDWSVQVNGIQVGTWVWTDALGSGTLNQSYSFAPITGNGTYTLRMAVTNEVPTNKGSIGIFIPSTAGATLASAVTAVPEPISILLLGTGFLALLILRARGSVSLTK